MAHTERRQGFAAKRGVASPRLVRMLGADARMSSNDEPDEEIDRGEATQPAYLDDDAAWAAFDLARGGPGKGERLARANDEHAMNLQIQMQGAIGELPR